MMSGVNIYRTLQNIRRRWLGGFPPPINFERQSLSPTNYISLEKKFHGEDSFQILEKYFDLAILLTIFAILVKFRLLLKG